MHGVGVWFIRLGFDFEFESSFCWVESSRGIALRGATRILGFESAASWIVAQKYQLVVPMSHTNLCAHIIIMVSPDQN